MTSTFFDEIESVPEDGGNIIDQLVQRIKAVEAKNAHLEAAIKTGSPEHASVDATEEQTIASEIIQSLETADESDIANLYSYTVEVALDSRSPIRLIACLCQLALLLSIQTLYSFGYYDASSLSMGIKTLPLFMDSLHISLFYSTSVVSGTQLPLVNLLCSLCSLALLALLMKNDNEGTLLTTPPLQLLLLGDGEHLLNEAERNSRRETSSIKGTGGGLKSIATRVFHVILCLLLHALMWCRALLMPMYAAFGAAGNFAGSSSAQDIVLNSVAIGFVFELDEWLYQALLNKDKRTQFEEGKPRPMSPLSSRHSAGPKIVSGWCWVCFLLDVSLASYYYLSVALPRDLQVTSVWLYALLRHYYFWRCGLFILASLHVAFCCGGSELGKRSFVLYSVVFTVMSLMLAAAVFSLAFRTINPALGIQLEGALLTPDPFACIMGMEPQGGIPCTMLHKTPGIYEAVAAKAAEVKPAWHMVELAWGALPFMDEESFMVQMGQMMAGG